MTDRVKALKGYLVSAHCSALCRSRAAQRGGLLTGSVGHVYPSVHRPVVSSEWC